MVETADEIRIYSSASKVHHGQGRTAAALGITDASSITLHTLRKDGYMYLEGTDDWGRFTTKPLTLLDTGITMNAAAPAGEVRYQLTDMESRPVDGFTFDDCQPMQSADDCNFPLSWGNHDPRELIGRIVRLEVAIRNARLYAFQGHWHFIDAQDRWMIEDEKELDLSFDL